MSDSTRASRVLVVEDDMLSRAAWRRALRMDHYETSWTTIDEALRERREFAPDVVILGLGLPEIDGVTLARELRKSGKDVPILLLTAQAGLESRVKGLDAIADGYLVKPFTVAEFRDRVRALLKGRPPDALDKPV